MGSNPAHYKKQDKQRYLTLPSEKIVSLFCRPHEGHPALGEKQDPIEELVDLRAGLVDDAQDRLAAVGHVPGREAFL